MQIGVDLRAEEFLARLRGAGSRFHAAVVRIVTRLSIEIQSVVKTSKLSGQVLHVRTGTLRRSINRVVFDDPGRVYAQIGTNVVYAGAHEYGFDGMVPVHAYLRRSRAQMSMARFRATKSGQSREIAGSYKKAGGGLGEVTVRAHTRHMHIPERSYLRSTMREFAVKIRTDLRNAALEALR